MSAEIQPFDRLMALAAQFTAALVMRPLSDAQRALLVQDLPHDVVRSRKQGGGSVDYVDGWYVITRLNEVFGFDGWTFEQSAPSLTAVGDRFVVHVVGTLRAGGVVRTDTGAAVTAGSSPDALETALKGAATDALKRCARTFGASLGLALYDKEQRTVGHSARCQQLIARFDQATTLDEHGRAVADGRADWDTLPPDEKAAVRQARDRAEKRLASSPAVGVPAPIAPQPPAPRPAPAPQPTPPPVNNSIGVAIGRAQSAETLVAVCLANGILPTSPWWEGVTTRAEELHTSADAIDERRQRAAAMGLPVAAWQATATILLAVDSAADAEALASVRKQHAAAAKGLPPVLLAGIKRATDERARALGAPTFAERLLAAVADAKHPDDLTGVYQRLQTAAANAQVTQAESERVCSAIHARGDEFAQRAA